VPLLLRTEVCVSLYLHASLSPPLFLLFTLSQKDSTSTLLSKIPANVSAATPMARKAKRPIPIVTSLVPEIPLNFAEVGGEIPSTMPSHNLRLLVFIIFYLCFLFIIIILFIVFFNVVKIGWIFGMFRRFGHSRFARPVGRCGKH
jgi:hypothetical protein